MAKLDNVGVRLEPEEREALQRAADADDRSMSALARRVIVEWLRANSWMGENDVEA
jgi:predicted transcriptional regulator